MLKDEIFDRETAVIEFLDGNDIPARFHDLMQAVILMAADASDISLREICAIYAEQHGRSLRIIEQTVKNAVCLGWEYASTPTSLLFSRRMQPEEFVRRAVVWLRAKETVFYRDRK